MDAARVCAAAGLLALALLGGAVPPVAAAPTRPTVPATVPDPSVLTASVTKMPGGRAVAAVEYPDVPPFGDLASQIVLVGADQDSYRTLEDSPMLSPDGTLAALDRADGQLWVLDLRRGTKRTVRLHGSHQTRALAFSPDGRFLVCGWSRDPQGTWVSAATLVELRTGRKVDLVHRTSPTAAFSPDGERIAVQVDGAVLIVDRTGRQLARLPRPGGMLANQNAWSPDGKWLALVSSSGGGNLVAFAAADGSTAVVPPPIAGATVGFLGWRSASELVVTTAGAAGGHAIAVTDLRGASKRVLAEVPNGYVYDVAGGLLPQLGVRTSDGPDRGPWPVVLWAPPLGALAAVVCAVMIRRRRSRAETSS